MKIIKPEDFPIEMSPENIDILANMALEDVISEEWREITWNILTDEENILICDRVCEIQDEKSKKRWDSLSLEEQEEEKRKIEESLNDTSNKFRGNLLQQELDSFYLSKLEKEKKKKL